MPDPPQEDDVGPWFFFFHSRRLKSIPAALLSRDVKRKRCRWLTFSRRRARMSGLNARASILRSSRLQSGRPISQCLWNRCWFRPFWRFCCSVIKVVAVILSPVLQGAVKCFLYWHYLSLMDVWVHGLQWIQTRVLHVKHFACVVVCVASAFSCLFLKKDSKIFCAGEPWMSREWAVDESWECLQHFPFFGLKWWKVKSVKTVWKNVCKNLLIKDFILNCWISPLVLYYLNILSKNSLQPSTSHHWLPVRSNPAHCHVFNDRGSNAFGKLSSQASVHSHTWSLAALLKVGFNWLLQRTCSPFSPYRVPVCKFYFRKPPDNTFCISRTV